MKVKDIEWKVETRCDGEDYLFGYNFDDQRITVLDRMTGFGYRDTETGYRDEEGKFWLASGGYDVRDCPEFTIQEAIAFVKHFANTCVGE